MNQREGGHGNSPHRSSPPSQELEVRASGLNEGLMEKISSTSVLILILAMRRSF